MRKLAAIAILSTLTAVGAVAAAGAANAHSSADYIGTITKNTWSYNGPSTEAAPVGSLQRGEDVSVRCYLEGHETDGSSIWLRVDGSQPTFVNRASIQTSPNVPHC